MDYVTKSAVYTRKISVDGKISEMHETGFTRDGRDLVKATIEITGQPNNFEVKLAAVDRWK